MAATKDYPEAQAVLAEYGRRRLSRNCVAADPRLVDMDDVSKKKRDNCNNVESNWSSSQNNDSKSENLPLNRINEANSPFQRASPLLSPPSPMFDPSPPNVFFSSSRPPSARGQLRPISRETYAEQARRRASLNGPIISSLESEIFSRGCVTKEDNEPLVKDFVDSCTESFNALKKTFQEKANKEISRAKQKVKTLEETIKDKESRIKWYEDHVCTLEKELKLSKSRTREMEYCVKEKEKRIHELEEELSEEGLPKQEGKQRPKKKSTTFTSCSTSSLLQEEHFSKK